MVKIKNAKVICARIHSSALRTIRLLVCQEQPHMAASLAGEKTPASMLDVEAVLVGQRGHTNSGCQIRFGMPDYCFVQPGGL